MGFFVFQHFCCARCAQPFRGSKHFENKGLAYCETDYHFLFGSSCFICNRTITEGGKLGFLRGIITYVFCFSSVYGL